MSSQKLLVPAPALSAEHLEPGGVYDLFGRELTHAHAVHAAHAIFAAHPALHYLAKRSAKHAADPAHESHQELADAFSAHVKGTWRVERYDAPIEWYVLRAMRGAHAGHISAKDIEDLSLFRHVDPRLLARADAAMKRDKRPYHVSEFEDEFLNLFTTAGVSALWNQAGGNTSAANTGASPAGANASYNNAQSRIGVGDSTTAATAGQTDLQAVTNKLWIAMDATFPTLPGAGSNQIVFRATFGSAQANFSWQEFGVDNCQGSNATSTTRSGGALLDRVVSNQGTKASGQTWQPSMTLSIS